MSKTYIVSVGGLGNSLLTALALKESVRNNKDYTIIINNTYAKTIFKKIINFECKFIIFKKNKSLKFILFLTKFIFIRKKIIIAEPNTSINLINLIRYFTLSKVVYLKTDMSRSLEEEYDILFKLKKYEKQKKKFQIGSSDYAMIYPTVENVEKESKKISEKQINSIVKYLTQKNTKYNIVIPKYEKNQLSENFIKRNKNSIIYIEKFNNFDELNEYLDKFDIYIGSDTFYYNIMSKLLKKKCYVVFGSTSFKRIIYRNENTKFVYPKCSNYPMYDKYFSKVKYCEECESRYCIDKLQIDIK